MISGSYILNEKINKASHYLPIIWFIATAVLYLYFYVTKASLLLDADMSSEMILADILTKEHSIISKNWFYSTELRFLNNQLIFGFFLLFGHNYHLSRILSGITLMAIMLFSYYYLLKQMLKNKNVNKYFFVTAPILLLPFSNVYSYTVLLGLYYIPHITISFFSMGLVFSVENKNSFIKKRNTCFILCILSLLAGIGGPRQIIIFYLPLLMAGLFRCYQTKKLSFISIYFAFISSCIGYLINSKVLIKSYKYNNWSGFSYEELNFDKLALLIQGFLNCFGFTSEEIFSSATIRTGAAFAFSFLLVLYFIYYFSKKNSLSEEELLSGSFFLFASIVYFLIYLFSDMFYEDRYILPFLVFLLPLIVFSLKDHNWTAKGKAGFTILFSLIILASSLCVYKREWNPDTTSIEYHETVDHRAIASFLLENEYYNGYASYWNANLITELANGKIDTYVWTSTISNVESVDDLYRWLQVKSHADNPPKGKVFILLSTDEYEVSLLKRYLSANNLVFATSTYYVFGFNSYKELKTLEKQANAVLNN